jgi:hypothetical protein
MSLPTVSAQLAQPKARSDTAVMSFSCKVHHEGADFTRASSQQDLARLVVQQLPCSLQQQM